MIVAVQRGRRLFTLAIFFFAALLFMVQPQPASYQKRSFPVRLDNLRGPGYFLVNANVVRNFSIGGNRSLQFRLDVQNLLDSVLWSNPTMDPLNSNFGKVTGATNSIMRFFTFVWKVNF